MCTNKTYYILLPLLAITFCVKAQNAVNHIQLNQIGFYTDAPKIAVVTGITDAANFYVLSAQKKDTVYKGILSAPVKSDYSNTTTRIADFSSLSREGD